MPVRTLKKVYWHTTFGQVEVEEQTYYQSNGGSLLRPFLFLSGINPRGYSVVLQRKITDFGADAPFKNLPHVSTARTQGALSSNEDIRLIYADFDHHLQPLKNLEKMMRSYL
jgi:hypothetical protein